MGYSGQVHLCLGGCGYRLKSPNPDPPSLGLGSRVSFRRVVGDQAGEGTVGSAMGDRVWRDLDGRFDLHDRAC